MRRRILGAVALVAFCMTGEGWASSGGPSPQGGTGAAPAAPQAPADLLLPPHLTGAFPHPLVLGQNGGLPTLLDTVRVVPAQAVPAPAQAP
jgi:hypothetical protein